MKESPSLLLYSSLWKGRVKKKQNLPANVLRLDVCREKLKGRGAHREKKKKDKADL